MKSKESRMSDTSGRFKTDKNFKNTIIKNCSRLRQRSTEDRYVNRNNSVQPRINNIKRITNFKKINSLKENFLNSKETSNNSKDNFSMDINANNDEKRRKRNFHTNIRKAFLNDINFETKENKENKEKDKNDSFIEVNKRENNDNKNDNAKYNRNRLLVKKRHNIMKNETNEGIKELIIDIKENNFTKGNYKRSNSIRRIMNSLYYHSYTSEKIDKKVCISNISEKTLFNNQKENVNENDKFNLTSIPTYKKNHNSILNNNNNYNSENNKNEKKTLNTNSNSSYIYKKKSKKFGNLHNYNNLIFNTYSTEDNSFITNDNNKEHIRKTNTENQNPKLIKVKIVYQKPHKRPQITKENTVSNNTVSINQTLNKFSRRRKILNEKKVTEDIDSKKNIEERKPKENYLTPIIRYSRGKKLSIDSKEEMNKKTEEDNLTPNTNENNNRDNYIVDFFDDIIELCNGIEERTIFDILTKNINQKYIIQYERFFLDKKINEVNSNFEYCFKYFCIIIITFFFLSKDEILYKYNSVKIHLLFIQYIYY